MDRNRNAWLKKAEQLICQSSVYILEGCFTHFATADEVDTDYYEQQYKKFTELLGAFSGPPKIIHSSNSASSFRFEKAWFNGIRLGISMYGLSPSSEMKELLPFPLKEALTLHTKIVNVKKIEVGSNSLLHVNRLMMNGLNKLTEVSIGEGSLNNTRELTIGSNSLNHVDLQSIDLKPFANLRTLSIGSNSLQSTQHILTSTMNDLQSFSVGSSSMINLIK